MNISAISVPFLKQSKKICAIRGDTKSTKENAFYFFKKNVEFFPIPVSFRPRQLFLKELEYTFQMQRVDNGKGFYWI